MAGSLYSLDFAILLPVVIILVVGACELGNWVAMRQGARDPKAGDIGTFAAAALGLLALLLAFAFSNALSHYDKRRDLVLQEANAIGSTANFAAMLPKAAQTAVLSLLRDYVITRLSLSDFTNAAELKPIVARSSSLQSRLWDEAVALTAPNPQSLPVYRFVASLNDMNNVGEQRITELRSHPPTEIMLLLFAIAMVAMGFAGYHTGAGGIRRRLLSFLMSLTISLLLMAVIDLNRPNRGLIRVPDQALQDTLQAFGS